MKLFQGLTLFGTMIFSASIWAYGLGVSTHPLAPRESLISTEFAGVVSDGKGVGIQTRYNLQFNRDLSFDAGFGVNDGDRSNRFFAGADYQIFPDYLNQPRIGTKLIVESAEEFDNRNFIIGMTPNISKGFNVYGQKVYPFAGIPLRLSLDGDTNSYNWTTSLALGVTGQIPIRGYDHIVYNLEANVKIDESFNAIFAGIGFPI